MRNISQSYEAVELLLNIKEFMKNEKKQQKE